MGPVRGGARARVGLDQGDAVAVAGVDRGSVDEDTIGLAAWAAARDAAFCACTNGTLARQTFNTYEARFAAWLAYLGADPSDNADAVAYSAAAEAGLTIL